MKNFNIMGIPYKIRFLRGNSRKTNMPKKGELGQFTDLRRGLHTMTTKVFRQFSLKCPLKYFVQRFVDKILQKHLLCISSELLLYLYF